MKSFRTMVKVEISANFSDFNPSWGVCEKKSLNPILFLKREIL